MNWIAKGNIVVKKQHFVVRLITTLVFVLAVSAVCSAQATRTWVSGVGDDANPCSRTAPCKTFQGAIAKTAAGGEINVLDPGGFGAVTITKSITISTEGFEAGILVSGTNGVVVNAAVTDTIVLRGLDFEGFGTGLDGITFLNGGVLHVEKCTFNAFNSNAIEFQPSNGGTGTANLFVKDSIIRGTKAGSGSATAIGGVYVHPGTGVTVAAEFDNVRMEKNVIAMRVDDGATVTVKNSSATGNTKGFVANSTSTAATIVLDSCMISGNTNSGITSTGTNAMVRMTNNTVTGNLIGLKLGGGTIQSAVNNRIFGNTTDGAPNQTYTQQ
jgi:hypothetical protein